MFATDRILRRTFGLMLVGVYLPCAAADTEVLTLVCDYPSMNIASAEERQAIPRELSIDLSNGVVIWQDAWDLGELSETSIKFERDGYEYTLSRVTGEIRFSNPSKFEEWREYRKELVPALIAQGWSPSQAHADVDARLRSEFSAQLHVGKCAVAQSKLF